MKSCLLNYLSEYDALSARYRRGECATAAYNAAGTLLYYSAYPVGSYVLG